jgi:cytochrome P450 family 4
LKFLETAMGYEMQDQDNEYLNAVRELNYQVANSFLSPHHRIKFIYNLTPTKRAQDRCANIMRKFTTKIIEERRKFLAQNDKKTLENLDDDDVGLKKTMCLLDVLLLSTVENRPLNNSEIQEEVDTFTFAGHDTTTNAICFTLYNIAKHPEVQKKLNSEIDEILGHGENLEFKFLGKFKYLDLVIKETLRLYPPVPIISRRLFEEAKLDDFIAPSNTNYNLGLYEIFHDEKNFDKPLEFIPERFLENVAPFAFIPFSAGPRNCIGQKFAMINIKTTVINILRNFELFDSNIKPRIELHITMKCSKLFIGFKRK